MTARMIHMNLKIWQHPKVIKKSLNDSKRHYTHGSIAGMTVIQSQLKMPLFRNKKFSFIEVHIHA